MAKLGKVIKGLECCKTMDNNCVSCPYFDTDAERIGRALLAVTGRNEDEMDYYCCMALHRDALALLKAQEPIPVKRIDGKRNHFLKCGGCNANLTSGMKFCPQCGRLVKWDG